MQPAGLFMQWPLNSNMCFRNRWKIAQIKLSCVAACRRSSPLMLHPARPCIPHPASDHERAPNQIEVIEDQPSQAFFSLLLPRLPETFSAGCGVAPPVGQKRPVSQEGSVRQRVKTYGDLCQSPWYQAPTEGFVLVRCVVFMRKTVVQKTSGTNTPPHFFHVRE